MEDLAEGKERRIQASGGKFQVTTPKLLYFLIVESQRLPGGQVLDNFWERLGTSLQRQTVSNEVLVLHLCQGNNQLTPGL